LISITLLKIKKKKNAKRRMYVLLKQTIHRSRGDSIGAVSHKIKLSILAVLFLVSIFVSVFYMLQLLSAKAVFSETPAPGRLSYTDLRLAQVINVPPAGPGQKYIEYRVQSGDTLGRLAEYFGTSVAGIRNINGITGDMINVGQILKIPAQYTDYKVVAGDTLASIARRFGTSVSKIMLFNRLSSYMIYPGQTLHVPYVPTKPTVTFITHTVSAGETPWLLSIKYGIPFQELLTVNGLSQSSTLSIGQKLNIPVYSIPVKATPGPQYGEYLDWWTEAQYLFPIGKRAKVIDFKTGRSFTIKRTTGASHADCEPVTSWDSSQIKSVWGGSYTWITRAVIVVVDGRRIAASMTSMPHGVEYIGNNGFSGHFDIHFKNSRRHKDDAIDPLHQAKVRIAAGVS
jgi:LysM repeat protein